VAVPDDCAAALPEQRTTLLARSGRQFRKRPPRVARSRGAAWQRSASHYHLRVRERSGHAPWTAGTRRGLPRAGGDQRRVVAGIAPPVWPVP
jgi:hypothetical protein